ncbi:MAG: ABC transporter substrate-binding protein, partial [Solirubrobacteraceae bacterium]
STVSRIDPATHAVVQTIPVGSTPGGIAVGAGAVWVANNFRGTVSRIDPAVNRVVQTIPVGNGPSGVAVGDGWVWVTNSSDGTLSRIDPVNDTASKPIALGGSATDVAAGFGSVWVSDEANGRVVRVDPQTNQVTQSINVGTGPSAITVGDRSVWVTNSLDGTVSRIDPQTNHVAAAITVGNTPNAIAAGAGGVWVADEFGATVVRISPTTNTVARTVPVGNSPRGLAISGGLVWVGAQGSGANHRGGTLTALQNLPFGSSDPESNTTTLSLAPTFTLYMTNDGLTAFKRVGGSDGAEVVPDLAMTIPTPTDGGKTYTFTLRRGIRYSNGQPLRPEDFRRAIERSFKVGRSNYYENIVGGASCLAHPSRCDLKRGIVTNDATGTVTFHLVAADPELPYKLAVFTAFAVPPGTPNHDTGTHPPPATGPYEIVSDTHRQVTLVRNPYFHEWSHGAQPDGYPDRIVWRIGASPQAEVTAVEHGHADYTPDLTLANRLRDVKTHFPSLLKENLADETLLLGLNTRVVPFDDLRVRRALNYAVDRAKLAQLLGQDSRPTCQTLPPYIPGYRPYCPYTLNPNHSGIWSGPDLAKARALIATSGTRGTPITIWIPPASAFGDFNPAGRYLVSLLDQLGYPTHLKYNASPHQLADSRTKAQAFLGPLAAAYPAASQYLGPQPGTTCKSFVPDSTSNPNWLEFCDPHFDATVHSALAAEAAGSPRATTLWTAADKQFTDQAPVVAFATPRVIDLVSHRVGDYQYNPQLSVLLDQLWVR